MMDVVGDDNMFFRGELLPFISDFLMTDAT